MTHIEYNALQCENECLRAQVKDLRERAVKEFENFCDKRIACKQEDSDIFRKNKRFWVRAFKKALEGGQIAMEDLVQARDYANTRAPDRAENESLWREIYMAYLTGWNIGREKLREEKGL